MEFNEYQEKASKVAIYPSCAIIVEGNKARRAEYIYPAIGLSDEAGEVAGKIKKIIRDKHGVLNADDKKALTKELGDVLWYLSELAQTLGIKLDDVAAQNIDKLYDRKERGVLKGSGDDR